MTPQEAIEIIKNGNPSAQETLRARKMAVSALEKQIPKKPNYEGDGYDENGELIYDTWICPCCEHKYEVDYDDYTFCPNCGQALDWGDT